MINRFVGRGDRQETHLLYVCNTTKETQHMSIYSYQPYFYIIQDTRNGMYYAGSKYGKKKGTITNPANFMVEGGYTTSSNKVNEIINENGLNSFVIRKIRLFKTKEETEKYEKRFLQKINAARHPLFYNGHNNDGYYDEVKRKQRMLEVHGVDNYAKHPDFPKKFRNTSQKNHGVDHHLQNPEIYAKHLQTIDVKYGVTNVNQIPESKERSRNTKEERYGNPTFVNPEKADRTCLECYGVRRPCQQPHIREKYSDLQQYRQNREIVEELKKLIEIAKYMEIDYGLLGLKRFWWQSNDDKLFALKNNLENAIYEKKASGFVKKSRKQKMKDLNDFLYNRPIVKQVKELASARNHKLGPAWWRKSDDSLKEMLESLR